jgi:hypothetical protein
MTKNNGQRNETGEMQNERNELMNNTVVGVKMEKETNGMDVCFTQSPPLEVSRACRD